MTLTAPDSQRVMPVLGSLIAGTLRTKGESEKSYDEIPDRCVDYRHSLPAIGVDLGELLALYVGNKDGFVLQAELLKDDGNLLWIGSLSSIFRKLYWLKIMIYLHFGSSRGVLAETG